jgi:hypothetical protein
MLSPRIADDREDVTMPVDGVGALWPNAENYARFREVCVEEMPETVEAYHANAARHFEALAAKGIAVERIPFDPDALAAWAAARGAEVNSQTRAAYAGVLLAERGRAH